MFKRLTAAGRTAATVSKAGRQVRLLALLLSAAALVSVHPGETCAQSLTAPGVQGALTLDVDGGAIGADLFAPWDFAENPGYSASFECAAAPAWAALWGTGLASMSDSQVVLKLILNGSGGVDLAWSAYSDGKKMLHEE